MFWVLTSNVDRRGALSCRGLVVGSGIGGLSSTKVEASEEFGDEECEAQERE